MMKRRIMTVLIVGLIGVASVSAYAYRGMNMVPPGQSVEAPELVKEEDVRETAEAYLAEHLTGYTIQSIEQDAWRPLYFITITNEEGKTEQLVAQGLSGEIIHDSTTGWIPGNQFGGMPGQPGRPPFGGQQQMMPGNQFQNMPGQRGGQQQMMPGNQFQNMPGQPFGGQQQMMPGNQFASQQGWNMPEQPGRKPRGGQQQMMPGQPEMLQQAVTEEKATEIAQEYLAKYLPGFSIETVEKHDRRPLYLVTIVNNDGASLEMAIHGYAGQVMNLIPTAVEEETAQN